MAKTRRQRCGAWRDEGRDFLDALVVQEALVVQHNRAGDDPLVAIYPHEGTLWEDHPLALLDDPAITDNQRRTFLALAEFLRAPEQQKRILDLGFRPADLSIPLDVAGSPIRLPNGVNPSEPQTTLQMPGPTVIQVVQNAWQYTKRPSNIFLVVDTSGSMEGDKLENVRVALQTFVGQIQGTQDRVGLVEFAGSVYNIIPPHLWMTATVANLTNAIDCSGSGRRHGDASMASAPPMCACNARPIVRRINAIVVMTDGRENASAVSLRQLVGEIVNGNEEGVPIVVFAIAYGDDADYATLNVLRRIQRRPGAPGRYRQYSRVVSFAVTVFLAQSELGG